jgi:hypothetical protein
MTRAAGAIRPFFSTFLVPAFLRTEQMNDADDSLVGLQSLARLFRRWRSPGQAQHCYCNYGVKSAARCGVLLPIEAERHLAPSAEGQHSS